MTSTLDMSKLRFLVLPTKYPEAKDKEDHFKAYCCWKEVWDIAFKKEMNVPGPLHSDGFTRQTHVAVLFYGDTPACLTTLNYFDLKDPVSMDDSFFKVWPEIALMKMKNEARTIVACCNVTVNFAFRRGAHGVCWKDLILALLSQHLKETSYDAMVAVVRLEKGMEKAAYRTGAHPISKNLPYTIEGQRVDIVAWDRKININQFENNIQEIVHHIYQPKKGIKYAA